MRVSELKNSESTADPSGAHHSDGAPSPSSEDVAAHDGESPGPGDIRACWLEIGLYGDGSCPELQKHIHCRNCPVYSSAGVRLLDRPLPEGYRGEWTAHFAREKQKQIPPARTSAVIFRVHSEWLALPTQ